MFLLHAAVFKKMLVGFKNSFLWVFQRTGCLPAKNVWNGDFLSTMSLCYGVESAGPSSRAQCRGLPNAIDPVLIKSSFCVGLGAKKSK